jgi:hypothetical protein
MLAEIYGGPAGPPICATLEEGIQNCATLDAVLASARKREWQDVAQP